MKSDHDLLALIIVRYMISSALFSRGASYENIEEIMVDFTDSEKMVNRSILYHLILSFVNSIQ